MFIDLISEFPFYFQMFKKLYVSDTYVSTALNKI